MKSKKNSKTTTNRGEFNRAYKSELEHSGKIHCAYCGYHRGENFDENYYGGFGNNNNQDNITHLKHPNWKLVSKNRKQWMDKPIKIVEKTSRLNKIYVEIKF